MMLKFISFPVRAFRARKICATSPSWSGRVDLVRLFALDLMAKQRPGLACRWQRDAQGRLISVWHTETDGWHKNATKVDNPAPRSDLPPAPTFVLRRQQ
jgi:hypothetical protein